MTTTVEEHLDSHCEKKPWQQLEMEALETRVRWLEACLVGVLDAFERTAPDDAMNAMGRYSLQEFRNFAPWPRPPRK